MQFQFYPLRFEFVAHESLYFPPGKASNTLRGALGVISRKIACRPECSEVRSCEIRRSCAYAQIFEPAASDHMPGPAGLADWPRPFVFRARHLDNRTIPAGDSFYFDLHVFTLDASRLSHFVLAFAELAREGLGPQRIKAELRQVWTRAVGGLSEQAITSSAQPTSLDLEPWRSAPRTIRIEFLSPTELKHENKIAVRPEFPILFGRIRDRISTLRALYGPGPLDIDFRAIGDRASAVRMTRYDVRREEADRRSTRTGQIHSIGGFVGFAEYEGDLAEFLPYLAAAHWTGVGRQAVWGKGEIAITSPALVPNSAATR
jgi:hypothetical protein